MSTVILRTSFTQWVMRAMVVEKKEMKRKKRKKKKRKRIFSFLFFFFSLRHHSFFPPPSFSASHRTHHPSPSPLLTRHPSAGNYYFYLIFDFFLLFVPRICQRVPSYLASFFFPSLSAHSQLFKIYFLSFLAVRFFNLFKLID